MNVQNWRNNILLQLKDQIAEILIIADQDNIISTDEDLLLDIQKIGYYTFLYEDSIKFRYIYELQYRDQKLLHNQQIKKLLVIFPGSQHNAMKEIPIDVVNRVILDVGQILSFTITEIFPKLSYSVLKEIDRIYFDRIYEAYLDYDGPILGDRLTKEFVLGNAFRIRVSTMKASVKEFVIGMLSLHYENIIIPTILSDYIIESLERSDRFNNWPLKDIISNSNKFFNFLQQEWNNYISSQRNSQITCKIPFEQKNIRVFLDNLFLEGFLKPVEVMDLNAFPKWIHIGIFINEKRYLLSIIQKLSNNIVSDIPTEKMRFVSWQKFAFEWSKFLILYHKISTIIPKELDDRFIKLTEFVDNSFSKWMHAKYFTLSSIPYLPRPVMVHHIPKFLNHMYIKNSNNYNNKKIILIVIDGMALDQWLIIKDIFQNSNYDLDIDDSVIFAWVPTITSISRQSIFAGEPPFFFEESLYRTDQDQKHWFHHWLDCGFQKEEIFYCKYRMIHIDEISKILDDINNKKVVGIVINTIDEIMHGTILGKDAMHQQIRLWIKKIQFLNFIKKLIDLGFDVYITSDHGNVCSIGQGRPRQGILVDKAGIRARIYSDETFVNQAKAQYPNSVIWPNWAMKNHYFLLANDRFSFANKNDKIVCHGGISIEEVLVPFVQIKGKINA